MQKDSVFLKFDQHNESKLVDYVKTHPPARAERDRGEEEAADWETDTRSNRDMCREIKAE